MFDVKFVVNAILILIAYAIIKIIVVSFYHIFLYLYNLFILYKKTKNDYVFRSISNHAMMTSNACSIVCMIYYIISYS